MDPAGHDRAMGDAREAAAKLRLALSRFPEGRARALALTKLDECEMWTERIPYTRD